MSSIAGTVKRGRRGNETRRRILDATTSIVSTMGMSAATVKAIAETVGIGPSHVLYYFPSREQLLLEALTENETTRTQLLLKAAEDAKPGHRLRSALLSSLPSNDHDREWLFWLGAIELAGRDAEASKVVLQLDAEHREQISRVLERERRDREIPALSPRQLRNDVNFLVAGSDGIANAMMTRTIKESERDSLLDRLIGAILDNSARRSLST